MKRSLNILMALMLSFMVVYLSVGTTVMHCLRSDKVMVGMMADCCVGHDCCQGKLGAQVKKHCMNVRQVKLSPTVSVQHMDFDTAPVFAGIVPALWKTLPRPVICSPPFSSRNLSKLNSFSQEKHFRPEETPLHHPNFSHGCCLILFPEILFRYIPAD